MCGLFVFVLPLQGCVYLVCIACCLLCFTEFGVDLVVCYLDWILLFVCVSCDCLLCDWFVFGNSVGGIAVIIVI